VRSKIRLKSGGFFILKLVVQGMMYIKNNYFPGAQFLKNVFLNLFVNFSLKKIVTFIARPPNTDDVFMTRCWHKLFGIAIAFTLL
jgi:hypothetical protein